MSLRTGHSAVNTSFVLWFSSEYISLKAKKAAMYGDLVQSIKGLGNPLCLRYAMNSYSCDSNPFSKNIFSLDFNFFPVHVSICL